MCTPLVSLSGFLYYARQLTSVNNFNSMAGLPRAGEHKIATIYQPGDGGQLAEPHRLINWIDIKIQEYRTFVQPRNPQIIILGADLFRMLDEAVKIRMIPVMAAKVPGRAGKMNTFSGIEVISSPELEAHELRMY